MSVSQTRSWDFEVSTRSHVDNYGWVVTEPIGWMTFTCGCGWQVYDRTDDAIAQGRDHIRTEHPTWEQVP